MNRPVLPSQKIFQSDWDRYVTLFYHTDLKSLTEEEQEFCKRMYHTEEVIVGLDGD